MSPGFFGSFNEIISNSICIVCTYSPFHTSIYVIHFFKFIQKEILLALIKTQRVFSLIMTKTDLYKLMFKPNQTRCQTIQPFQVNIYPCIGTAGWKQSFSLAWIHLC